MTTLHEQINSVLEDFNFEKVRKVMEFLNWTWVYKKHSPSIIELRDCARDLLNEAVLHYEKAAQPEYGISVATGGFIARVETFIDGQARLELVFYVDWASYHHAE